MICYLLKECWRFEKFQPVSPDIRNHHHSKTADKYYIMDALSTVQNDKILKNTWCLASLFTLQSSYISYASLVFFHIQEKPPDIYRYPFLVSSKTYWYKALAIIDARVNILAKSAPPPGGGNKVNSKKRKEI